MWLGKPLKPPNCPNLECFGPPSQVGSDQIIGGEQGWEGGTSHGWWAGANCGGIGQNVSELPNCSKMIWDL